MNSKFIADLHLSEKSKEITELFLNFLCDGLNDTEALYILGDLFDTWIGDDDNSIWATGIKKSLKDQTAQGTKIYLIRGNRDFLLGGKFAAETGCEILPDETVVDLYGTPTLIMHGDTLCADDMKYIRYRSFIRHPLCRWAFLRLPLTVRKWIAAKMRIVSTRYGNKTKHMNRDVAIRKMQAGNVQQMICGHFHQAAIDKDEQATIAVLGTWADTSNVLVVDNNKEFYFVMS